MKSKQLIDYLKKHPEKRVVIMVGNYYQYELDIKVENNIITIGVTDDSNKDN